MCAELITRVEDLAAAESSNPWWFRYVQSIRQSGLTETSIRVVDLDTSYIVERGILGAGRPEGEGNEWPSTRVRRGLVVGSVQSGKTASMLGVVAKSLDAGVNIVIILGGTRIALWRQTVDRTIAQLDGWTSSNSAARKLARVMLPRPELVSGVQAIPPLEDLYREHPNLVARNLAKGRPLIAIVMKQGDHLIRVGEYLRGVVQLHLASCEAPLHMLVIDDEADDGSILDAVVEQGLEADSERFKQIPRHIVRLWAGMQGQTSTQHSRLFATYLAYTATPQANILQSDHNPLSPSHFVLALRTPYARGAVEAPRETTFEEPLGLRRYYTGGEMFYRELARSPELLCVAMASPKQGQFASQSDYAKAVEMQRLDALGDSLRGFFVASAMRLLHSGRRLSVARSMSPDTHAATIANSPAPHSMLVHPSGSIDAQLRSARLIAAWSANPNLDSSNLPEYPHDHEGRAVLDAEGLQRRLVMEPELWHKWVNSYELTRQELASRFTGHGYVPTGPEAWPELCRLLVEEVFPHVTLRVINSDPLADDRPEFQPIHCGGGLYRAAPDLQSIFVSGNVMSRGITIEGLTTTLFSRDTYTPSADVQMQMQRWFGYRGSHLLWCRVFLYEDQLSLFRAYHENDEAMRAEIVAEMNRDSDRAPSPLILQGWRFKATGKIANLRALPLCPGAEPFVRLLGTAESAEHNCNVLADLLDKGAWEDLVVRGVRRGVIWDRALSMLELATTLESLRYADYDPDPNGSNHDRWRALAVESGLDSPVAPLFRPPGLVGPTGDRVPPHGCPYTIAAYLRLWNAVLSRRARGLFPTDDSRTPWSMINLSSYAASAPRFNVGVRFGLAGLAKGVRLSNHGIVRMDRQVHDNILDASWGSRNPGLGPDAYLGDDLFDYHRTGLTPAARVPDEPPWRPRGHPGLVLFHVVRTGAADSVAVGITLPLGGPDHFSAQPTPMTGPRPR
jgi:hypothetical protein